MANDNKLIVIKIGTSTLTGKDGHVDAAYLVQFATQVAELHNAGHNIIIVSSGAIIAGLEVLSMPPERPDDMPTIQAAAAIGQLELAKQYFRAFRPYRILISQVLLTRFDFEHEQSREHARNTLDKLMELGTIPLINENDTVATDEISFGDNDTLAAQVALLTHANLVVLLSDIDGLYTADPRANKDAKLIDHVDSVTDELRAVATGAGTHKGSGGMVTKLEAADLLMASGIPMVICDGRSKNVICDAACGKPVGTLFKA
jgi:glutamate 5-kinase